MKPDDCGSWFVLVVTRPDKRNILLDRMELSSIPSDTLTEIVSAMTSEGIISNDNGDWWTLEFHEDFVPYNVPPGIQQLARFVARGTIITLDNGCYPSVEWHFKENAVEVFDDYDLPPGEV
jgi:hypothetical protein